MEQNKYILGSTKNYALEKYVSVVSRRYESFSDVGEIRVWWRADFQSGSRVLKKVF